MHVCLNACLSFVIFLAGIGVSAEARCPKKADRMVETWDQKGNYSIILKDVLFDDGSFESDWHVDHRNQLPPFRSMSPWNRSTVDQETGDDIEVIITPVIRFTKMVEAS